MASPGDWARKNALLSRLVAEAGRSQDDVERSVSVGLCFDESDISQRFGPNWPQLRPSILTGSPDNMIEHIGSYVAAGADTIILSLRPPYSVDDIERFAKEVMSRYA
jgi:alkanesulfonate monooxygenase SsuD/methylene tetrahydromethanopterin reductase-like flavin-dependent oxidoreductase (luciferase family)